MIFMIKECKVYECDICGTEEVVEDGISPDSIVSFEIYDLHPCICKRCLKLALNAYGVEINNLADLVLKSRKEE
jgi:hypothetical protein